MSVLPLNLPEIHTLIFSTIFLKTTKYVVHNYGHGSPKNYHRKKVSAPIRYIPKNQKYKFENYLFPELLYCYIFIKFRMVGQPYIVTIRRPTLMPRALL